MNESTAKRRPVKRITSRRLSWHAPWLTLTLAYTDGKSEATVYRVEEVGSDLGRTFDLIRVDDGPEGDEYGLRCYRVSLAGNGQQACQCRAMAYKQTCKHTAALRLLVDTGRLAGGYPGGEPEIPEMEGER